MTEYLSQVVYNQDSNRWRDISTGRFVSETTVRQEVSRHMDAAQANLQSLTRELYSGNITLSQWQSATALELKDAHLAQAMFAVGGRDNMTAANYGRVGGTLRDEYRYLSQFAQDIADGRVSEAQALNRIAQYGNDTGQSYWREWSRQQDDIAMLGLTPLSRVPQDGSTQCHGNCKCYLSTQTDGIYWELTAAESCPTCIEMSDGNPWGPMR